MFVFPSTLIRKNTSFIIDNQENKKETGPSCSALQIAGEGRSIYVSVFGSGLSDTGTEQIAHTVGDRWFHILHMYVDLVVVLAYEYD